MALTVEKINGDTSFLLTFAPVLAPEQAVEIFPGTVTILVDPWLGGHSSIWHPAFQISHHTIECSIPALSALSKPPDVVVISQDKPDHCHEATLRSMPKDWPTVILAPPAAAKRIRSWKHFVPNRILTLAPYRRDRPNTVFRFPVSAYTSSSSPGEVTVSYLPSKHDMTGVHTALGITYCPPGSLLTTFEGGTVHLSQLMTPTATPDGLCATPHDEGPLEIARLDVKAETSPGSACIATVQAPIGLPTPPDSSHADERSFFAGPLVDPRTHKEKPISVIYAPHGIPSSALTSFVQHHLVKSCAYPPTAIFHSFNTETNPWFLGGRVVAGAPGGCRLAKELQVKHWFSAHDEVKTSRGVAVAMCKSQQYAADKVLEMLRAGDGYDKTTVHSPLVGERIRVI